MNIEHCTLHTAHTHTVRTEQMPYMELHRSNALAYGIQNNITTHYIKQYGMQIQSYAIYIRDCTLCLLLLFFCLFIKTFFLHHFFCSLVFLSFFHLQCKLVQFLRYRFRVFVYVIHFLAFYLFA